MKDHLFPFPAPASPATAAAATRDAPPPRAGRRRAGALAVLVLVTGWFSAHALSARAAGVPVFDHVVIVVEENKQQPQIIGSANAPYINSLAQGGASFTNMHAIEHPSQPNYLDMFSGSNQGITGDECPIGPFSTPNLGQELLAAGKTFAGYSEGLPSVGSTACSNGSYQRKHVPWANFSNVPASANQPFTNFPQNDFASLPTISYVIPNQANDMHDGTVQQGDTWLKTNLDAYAQWAKTHNSLLIVTWDEDDFFGSNQIATVFYGANVKPGNYPENVNHYNVLRTLEDMHGLSHAGNAASATPITDVWSSGGSTTTTTGPGSTTTTKPSTTSTTGPTTTKPSTTSTTAATTTTTACPWGIFCPTTTTKPPGTTTTTTKPGQTCIVFWIWTFCF